MARRKVVKIQAKNKSGYTEDDDRVREQVITIRRLLMIISDLTIEICRVKIWPVFSILTLVAVMIFCLRD